MCPQYLLERLLYTGEVKNTGSAKFGGGGGGDDTTWLANWFPGPLLFYSRLDPGPGFYV